MGFKFLSPRNDPYKGFSTEDLIELAVTEEAADTDACSALVSLHERGSREVLDAALALCVSPDATRRATGARILGELGQPRAFPDECCDMLIHLLETEKDERVLTTAVFAFGHLGNRRCEPHLIKLQHHQNPIIRYGVAFSLCGTTSRESIEVLLELMEDMGDPRIRDWATTSIGQIVSIDSPRIREALLQRTVDEDEIVRAEALHGLARRGDARVVPFLIKEMQMESARWHLFEDAAKCFLGYPEDAKDIEEDLLALLKQHRS